MNSLIEQTEILKYSNKIAIKLCSDSSVLNKKTYKEVYSTSEKLDKTFKKKFKGVKNKCLGLLMDQNVYIPSIVISLQKLNFAFIFLSTKNFHANTKSLHLDWVLSFEQINDVNYNKVCEIKMENNETLLLWKHVISQDLIHSFDNILCVVTTSGSTGEHKIIKIPYNCIVSNAINLGNIFNISSEDTIFWGTPLSFDPSLIELLLSLLNGATLIIVPRSTYINPQLLFSALFNVANITFLQMVPSVFLRWNETKLEKIICSSTLKILALGGETFPKSVLKFNRQSSLRMFNVYGITELSCWASIHEIQNETVKDDIPIGTSLNDTLIKVYDENLIEISEGIGEVYLGSKTRKCLIINETENINSPMFRETGDLVLIENGNIYYKGRKNKIIKRFGQKVNLVHIEETILNEFCLVAKCIWSQRYNKILTFILIKDNHSSKTKEKIVDKLRNKLIHILPEASFPDYFEIIPNLPVTLHGKVDEKKLEIFYTMQLSSTELNVIEVFTNLWCKYLGIGTNHLEHLKNHSFQEMGGNSINILQLIEEFNGFFKVKSNDELVLTIFEKKFIDCKDLVAKMEQNMSKQLPVCAELELKIKKPKLERSKMKILWKYNLKACVDSSPLIFVNGPYLQIAVGSFCNIFVVLDENGKEIFKEVLSGPIESTPSISPCKKYIFVGCYDGTMHCLDINEKRKIWQFKSGDRIKSSSICCGDRMSIIFGSYDKHIYRMSTVDGSVIWKIRVDGSIASNLLVVDVQKIIVTTTHGSSYCIQKTNGKIEWTFNIGSPIFGTPCILSDYEQLVVPSVLGVIFCLSLKNGKLIWKFRGDGNVFSSIVKFEDNIIFGCHDKHIYVLKLSPTGYISVRKCQLHCEISSTPLIYDNKDEIVILNICNDGTIYKIDFKTLNVLEKVILPGQVFSSPVTYNNKLYVGCRDNYLYCLLAE